LTDRTVVVENSSGPRVPRLLLIEPRGVLDTGHEGGERTATNNASI